MRLLLLNGAGHPLACFEDFQRYADRSPAQVFALLDLVEKLIKTASREMEQPGRKRPHSGGGWPGGSQIKEE